MAVGNDDPNFQESKDFGTYTYPVEANVVTSLLRRCEPLLTPELLKSRYLKDVNIENYSEAELKQEIELAMNEFELMTDLSVTRVQHRERIPFDRQMYKSFVFMKLNNGPIHSIEEILIESSNGENIYKLPPDWIDMGYAHKRQINLIPILSIFGAAGLKDGQASNAGLIFIQAVNNFRWLPAFYTVKYTVGLSKKDGSVPIMVNDIIGMTAAMNILSNRQSRFIVSSSSISQDGISQSSSTGGTKVFQTRIEDMQARRDKMIKKLRSQFHQKYFLSNI